MWQKWHIPINRKLREESGSQIIQWVGMAVFLVILLGGVVALSQNRGGDVGHSAVETIDSWVQCLGENNCENGEDAGKANPGFVNQAPEGGFKSVLLKGSPSENNSVPKPKKCKWWNVVCHVEKGVNGAIGLGKKAVNGVGDFFKSKGFSDFAKGFWKGFSSVFKGFGLQAWEGLKGTGLFIWDMVRLPFDKGVQDKYLNQLKNFWENFKKDPLRTAFDTWRGITGSKVFADIFEEGLRTGKWGEAAGRGIFEGASLFSPSKFGNFGKFGKFGKNLPGGGKPKPVKPDAPVGSPAKPGRPDAPDPPSAKLPEKKPPTTKPPEPDTPNGSTTKPPESKPNPNIDGEPTSSPKFSKDFDDLAAKNGKTPDEFAKDIAKDVVVCANSFSADTLVTTAYGLRPIGRLTVGTKVLAYNEMTHSTDFYDITVLHVHRVPVIVLLVIDGEFIKTTPEHPFYTDDGWVDAGDLVEGDVVMRVGGDLGRVYTTQTVPIPQTMYNLTVDTAHTYFVGRNQWLVHNKGGGSCSRHSAGSPEHKAETQRKNPGLTDEDYFSSANREIDAADGGHSIDRHGPDTSNQELKRRIKAGEAPDGALSPTIDSTRFSSNKSWFETRDAAISRGLRENGLSGLTDPPKPGHRGATGRIEIIMDHGRPIGDGFRGDASSGRQINGRDNRETFNGKTKHHDGLTTTKTTLNWDPAKKRWVVAQHFPTIPR